MKHFRNRLLNKGFNLLKNSSRDTAMLDSEILLSKVLKKNREGVFVYKHFDAMSGVSFLPHFDHVYQQAPYQECTEDEYNDMISKTTKRIDWEKLKDFEKGDTTSGSQTMACSGDSCEIVDIGA